MGLLNTIHGETIFIDTAAFIYFVERTPAYVDVLRPVFNAIPVLFQSTGALD